MQVLKTVLIAVEFILSLGLIVIVTLQSSKGEGLGAIGGGGQLFFSQNKGLDAFLDRLTSYVAIAFLIVSAVLALV